jgi:hypothetical protein
VESPELNPLQTFLQAIETVIIPLVVLLHQLLSACSPPLLCRRKRLGSVHCCVHFTCFMLLPRHSLMSALTGLSPPHFGLPERASRNIERWIVKRPSTNVFFVRCLLCQFCRVSYLQSEHNLSVTFSPCSHNAHLKLVSKL